MKVLVVLYKFGTTDEVGKILGSYNYFLSQLKALKDHGVEITVLAPWVSWLNRGSTNVEGIKVIRYFPKLATRRLRNLLIYKCVNRFYIWKTARMVGKIATARKVDIIYVRQARETGVAVVMAKRKLENVPIVFQPITTWKWHFENSQDSWWKKVVKDTKNQKRYSDIILKKFDFFITYNQTMRDEYVSLGANSDTFTIIPGAVEHEIFKPIEDKKHLVAKLGLPKDKKIILYIGRINFAEKGLGYLLSAYKKVVSKVQDIHLILIGPATAVQKEKLAKKIVEQELKSWVSYLGKKDYYTLTDYINCAAVGVIPSIWFESSGRVSLDMLSCGLPVVVTNTGGLSEYSEDGKTGFVVPAKDADALAEALTKIISSEALQREMSANARRHVIQNYTLEKTTEQFISFLKKIKR